MTRIVQNMNCTMKLTQFNNIPAFTINGHTGHQDIKALFCLGKQECVLSTTVFALEEVIKLTNEI